MTELLAPGGSFASAIRGFENGADAVYLGLSEFSARKGAVNFTLEHLRRLRTAYPERLIYLALNTLVADADLPRAGALIQEGRDAGINALIVQDPGIARIARQLEPDLPLQASTQMAVYNIAGATELADAGFSRVVLARECTLGEIQQIREALPELELEVFIHGALCYGFSGLCQASQLILGRSANRGVCGQICRTWFKDNEHQLFPFSQNDLALGEKVLDLVDSGVASLKIEGRMKGPEYVGTVCAYYRAILDKHNGAAGEADIKALAEDAALRFSRNQTLGWTEGGKGRNLLNPSYSGVTGITAGQVISSEGRYMRIEAATGLGSRDGLMWLTGENPSEPTHVSLRFREKGKHSMNAGEKAWIEVETTPPAGTELRLLSRSDGGWPEVKDGSWRPAKTPISLRIIQDETGLQLTAARGEFTYVMNHKAQLDEARNPGRFADAIRAAFSATGESLYICNPIDVELPPDRSEPFIPAGALKSLRRSFLESFSESYAAWKKQRVQDALASENDAPHERPLPSNLERHMLVSSDWDNLPFPLSIDQACLSELPEYDGTCYLPLPPVEFGGPGIEQQLKSLTACLEKSALPLCIGLSNQGHVLLARRLAEMHNTAIGSGKLSFFLDYSLYVVNHQAWDWYRERIPGLGFFVQSLESEADNWPVPDSKIPFIVRGDSLRIPLFIGRSCPVRHAGLDGNPTPGNCPPDCTGNRDIEIAQNRREYRVIIRKCVTYIIEK